MPRWLHLQRVNVRCESTGEIDGGIAGREVHDSARQGVKGINELQHPLKSRVFTIPLVWRRKTPCLDRFTGSATLQVKYRRKGMASGVRPYAVPFFIFLYTSFSRRPFKKSIRPPAARLRSIEHVSK